MIKYWFERYECILGPLWAIFFGLVIMPWIIKFFVIVVALISPFFEGYWMWVMDL